MWLWRNVGLTNRHFSGCLNSGQSLLHFSFVLFVCLFAFLPWTPFILQTELYVVQQSRQIRLVSIKAGDNTAFLPYCAFSHEDLLTVIWYCSRTVTFLLYVLPDSSRNMLVGLERVGLFWTAQGLWDYVRNVCRGWEKQCLHREAGLTFFWWMPDDTLKVLQWFYVYMDDLESSVTNAGNL